MLGDKVERVNDSQRGHHEQAGPAQHQPPDRGFELQAHQAHAEGRDRELERLLARANQGGGAKPILELNMRHDLVRALAAAKTADRGEEVGDISHLLLDQAHILDGELPADPAAFARRLNAYVVRATKR